jgi:DNA-binding HxlR family transcriptional regulator
MLPSRPGPLAAERDDGSRKPGYAGAVVTISTDHPAPLDEPDPAMTTGLEPAQCAVARCADVVSGKWTLLVVRDLANGPRSYSELEASLAGISPRTLCDRLKLLATAGLVSRTRIKALPPRTLYELTEGGRKVLPMIETLREVGEMLLATPPDASAAEAIGADDCCS